ncbi:tetratricopeptide repeat protein [Colwellia sp. MEBiC06753]
MKNFKLVLLLISTLGCSSSVFAQETLAQEMSAQDMSAQEVTDFDQQLLNIQHQWAKVNYSLSGKEQEQAYETLIADVEQFTQANAERAEAWIWQGIIQSSFAGAKGGLGALSYAKAAKKSLEKALSLNEQALDGSAYTSLGTLYHKVPGWPIAFGDDDDAKVYLEKAIAINPQGIDPNYFYGEFLYDEGEYVKAKDHLVAAQRAPARLARPLADESRHHEIDQLLAKVEKKLKKKHKN